MYKLLYDYRRERGSNLYLTRVMEIARKMGLLYPNYLKASYVSIERLTGMELDVLKLMAEEKENLFPEKVSRLLISCGFIDMSDTPLADTGNRAKGGGMW